MVYGLAAERGVAFPVVKEEKQKLSLYRQEVMVYGKDGVYPAVQATFAALTEPEKEEMVRLVDALGFPKEQLLSAFESILRHSIIFLIFNKDRSRAVATGQIDLMQQFGSPEIGISRLGAHIVAYHYVEEAYRGKHFGKELFRLSFEVLKSGYFHRYIQQAKSRDLKLTGQKLDGKPVTKRMLLEATKPKNLLVYGDFRDKGAHFGRCFVAADAAGMEATPLSEKILKQYTQLTVKQYDDYLQLYLFIGTPDTNTVDGKVWKSRRNTQMPIYFYGDMKLREQIREEVSNRLVAAGAQFQENGSYYFGCSPEVVWEIVNDLSSRTAYERILNRPNSPQTTEKYKSKFKGSKKLHMVTVQQYDTHRLALGFPTKGRTRKLR